VSLLVQSPWRLAGTSRHRQDHRADRTDGQRSIPTPRNAGPEAKCQQYRATRGEQESMQITL